MALISNDLTVHIAEHVDMDSMVSLMLSSRANYRLIRGYERSIVKAKLARMAHDPILRPPLGALLSSSTVPGKPGMGSPHRSVLEPESFAVAAELDLRDRRINDLFNPKSSTSLCAGRPLTETISRLSLFQNLPPDQMERLIDGLKDACRVADRIADCAASVHLEQQNKPTTTAHLKDNNHAPGEDPRAIDHETHLTRQQYIRSLPPIRLAFLTLLASLLGAEYAQQLQQSPHPDPFQWERTTAFKEAFLRHGTVLVAALLGPSERWIESETESNPEATTASTCGGGGGFVACQPDAPRTRSGSATRYYTSQVTAVLMELLAYEGGHWGFLRPAGDEGEMGHHHCRKSSRTRGRLWFSNGLRSDDRPRSNEAGDDGHL
ncbi:hypothetical protein CHGG_08150 [Chaetomium globosum CBS 148.51]|uniref:Uncharacterized protein n=1 Tax=Chaetomium globosum (strain ATCC 6205 / CBS 148.51 / DSM 1962 / NBRC 6347 / NRRL 1970) TaxID=306901 RepID=Q2GV54_CHAGB|nr:uncharacterized protein CHGG_08150 [Chaetomium globosum CBS 148.51]EAQ86897.1 hypothetical protein CHGG_08150 [Chaetomium globosum CBS 148.51]